MSSCSKFCQQKKPSPLHKQLHLGSDFAHVQGSCFAIWVRPQFKKMPRGHGPSKSLSAEIPQLWRSRSGPQQARAALFGPLSCLVWFFLKMAPKEALATQLGVPIQHHGCHSHTLV